jgi:hypothetical protein
MADRHTLAVKLDQAEAAWRNDEESLHAWSRLRVARQNYFAAIRKRWLDEQNEFDLAKLVRVDIYRVARLRNELAAAQARLAELHELGEGFYSFRDLLDAEAAVERAEGRFDFFAARLAQARRDEILIKAGKMKRPKTRLVSDGFVRTGYKIVDGRRVPIWEKIL